MNDDQKFYEAIKEVYKQWSSGIIPTHEAMLRIGDILEKED